jgi:hypothetical protein
MNPFLQTLSTLLKIVGKVGFLAFMAVKNFVFICVEVLVVLLPNREVRSEKTEKR